MGANAQTAVPAFTAGQVLTAAQQTQINTGIPVFATTTTRDAAFGGTGEKVLAEGQFAYIEASDTTQYYDGTSWQTLGASGLTLITSTTSSTATTVTVDNVFSSTYTHYFVMYSYSGGSTEDILFQFRYGTTTQTSTYFSAFNAVSYTGGSGVSAVSNGSSIRLSENIREISGQLFISYVGNASEKAYLTGQAFAGQSADGYSGGGYVNTAQTYTGFILSNSGGSAIFTGRVSVYGLAK